MNANASIVFGVSERPDAIHEEAAARAGGTDRLHQSLLRYRWDQCLRRSRLSIFGHYEQYPRQAPLA